GTMIQQYKLSEQDYRGKRFADWNGKDLKGSLELLNLTQPQVVEEIHAAYLEAGADLIETNTFSGTTIGLHDFLFQGEPKRGRKDQEFFQRVTDDVNLRALVHELNFEAAKIARRAADRVANETGLRRFVGGSMGPLPVAGSVSPDVNDQAFRAVSFDQLRQAYFDEAEALLEGGVDLLIVETIFDTLNGKAALFAIAEALEKSGSNVPLMISGTVIDKSGRNLSGQTVEALLISMEHARPLILGLNCALGPDEMQPFIEELSRIASFYVGAYPNAGLPDPLSPTGFPETPESFAPKLAAWVAHGWLNLVGGCCGTTPEHLRAIVDRARDCNPRTVPDAHASEAPGSARASRAGFGAFAETSTNVLYGKRNLPHFERPWAKYAVTFSTRNDRQLIPPERDIVLRSIVHGAEQNQYKLYVACVMPDHVHLLFEPQVREQGANGETIFWSMTEILHGIKSASAHRINTAACTQGPV